MPMEGLCPLEQVCSRQLFSKAPTRWTPAKLRHKRQWRPSAGATAPPQRLVQLPPSPVQTQVADHTSVEGGTHLPAPVRYTLSACVSQRPWNCSVDTSASFFRVRGLPLPFSAGQKLYRVTDGGPCTHQNASIARHMGTSHVFGPSARGFGCAARHCGTPPRAG